MREFHGGYQARDHEVVDYRMAELPGTGSRFRGPLPASLEPGAYFAAIGAAQTFGCYCESPYPALLARSIGLPALNLGYAGAGPEFFLHRQEASCPISTAPASWSCRSCRRAARAIRSTSSAGLEFVTLRRDGSRMPALDAFEALLAGPAALDRLPLPARARRKLGNLASRPAARALVAEIRDAWVASAAELMGRIEVPVVLLWFSRREPSYRESYASPRGIWGEFPSLSTRRCSSRCGPTPRPTSNA